MPLKRAPRRRHAKHVTTLKSLSKKIAKVSREDRPTYYIYDDYTADPLVGSGGGSANISIGQVPVYKYIGYQYGASSSAISQITSGTLEGDIRGNNMYCASLSIRGEFLSGPVTEW